jgi:uncharacterized protein DUF2252
MREDHMDVVTATANYERWLSTFCPLHEPDVEYKHAQMSDPHDPFPFFRGAYYRWTSLWRETCPEEVEAPRVLAVGDLHVENFGTWRDADGRLCWGVNDFDEADELPYTNDLVRLASSMQIARITGRLDIKLGWACRAILTGYLDALEEGGIPFVLEERHPELRAMALDAERDPVRFWKKLTRLLSNPSAEPPDIARDALLRDFPNLDATPELRVRPEVGMGSLGKPRYVALAEWNGGWVAREAKAVAPPATDWLAGRSEKRSVMEEVAARAIRCPDPFYRPGRDWVVRRLAPHCSKIELAIVASSEDVLRLLWAMGGETANIHLGTPGARRAIVRDLSRRPKKWLNEAARAIAQAIVDDWRDWSSREASA